MVMAVSVISAVKETFITTNALSIEVVVALPYDFLRH